MTQSSKHDALTEKITQSLNQQAEAIDTATLSRLQQARTTALEQADNKQQFIPAKALWAGGLMTFAALSIIMIMMWPAADTLTPDLGNHIADITLITDQDDMELYDDLDFYLWLDQGAFDSGET